MLSLAVVARNPGYDDTFGLLEGLEVVQSDTFLLQGPEKALDDDELSGLRQLVGQYLGQPPADLPACIRNRGLHPLLECRHRNPDLSLSLPITRNSQHTGDHSNHQYTNLAAPPLAQCHTLDPLFLTRDLPVIGRILLCHPV